MNKYQPVRWTDKNGISWTVQTIYVDERTGEIISKKNGNNKNNYIIIKTIKYGTEYNNQKTRATITYTKLCRRQPQRELNFG